MSSCETARLIPQGAHFGSVHPLGTSVFEGHPDVLVEFVGYTSDEGECVSAETIVDGKRTGSGSSCHIGGDGSLLGSGPARMQSRHDFGVLMVISGTLSMQDAHTIQVEFASGELVEMDIDANGLYHSIFLIPELRDPDFEVEWVRALSQEGVMSEEVDYRSDH